MAERQCIVAVGAHAADMEFTAGATLLKHARQGWDAHIINLTLGEKGSARLSPAEYGEQKRAEALACAEILQAEQHFLPLRDGELTVCDSTARELAVLFRTLRPSVIITHWRHSIHSDHEATHHLTRRAFFIAANRHFAIRGLPPTRWARTYYADNWEDPQGFVPYAYVDISEVLDDWARAFSQFAIGRAEGGYPYWDWYEARTRLHGIATGCHCAQAFAVEPENMRQVRDTL